MDDHPGILDTVSAMLSHDFDVVGAATNGSQALDMAGQVHPDVIVLDIEMPGTCTEHWALSHATDV